jgi:hypothetical protein
MGRLLETIADEAEEFPEAPDGSVRSPELVDVEAIT